MASFPGLMRSIYIDVGQTNTLLWENLPVLRVNTPQECLGTSELSFILQNQIIVNEYPSDLNTWVFECVHPSCAAAYGLVKQKEDCFLSPIECKALEVYMRFREFLVANSDLFLFPLLKKQQGS